MRYILETTSLQLEFEKDTGNLIRLYSKVSDWEIIKRYHLGLSWKIMIPLTNKRDNIAWGHLQPQKPQCRYEVDSIEFTWDSVTTEFGGVHPITVTSCCSARNDQVVFSMYIQNNDSSHIVENVYYPYIGDLHRPKDCKRLEFYRGGYAMTIRPWEFYPSFQNPTGTHSDVYPTLSVEWTAGNPPMYPFGLISDDKGNGLYIGIVERRLEAVTWHAEYLPGWKDSMSFSVFDEDTFDGKENYIRFSVGHLPYISPGTSFNMLPFALEAYKGSWSAGAKCYTKISQKWNVLPVVPQWAKAPHSWLQVHINSPEDELRIPFRKLGKLGEECKKYGINAIQLVGWNNGGQDRGNPSHTPDPRLGAFSELTQAIAEIQEMGVKVILFAKFTWADQSREDFKEIYEPLAIKDPYGNYYLHNGFQYMTLTQMANVNTRRLIPMCFGTEKYIDICNREFQKCVDLGADGILFDECLHHGPALCCFDESHGHRNGEAVYRFDERLIKGFREIVKGKEFLIAGEAVYDFQYNYYDVSYGRTWGADHRPMSRMIRPSGQIMTAVVGFDDRNMINQCLLNRYIISYEPYNFKGRPSDFPRTVLYGTKMDALRTELREYFWDGEFSDTLGATVTTLNDLIVFYSVFTAKDASQGVVVCNYDVNMTAFVLPELSSGKKLTHYRLIDWNDCKEYRNHAEIPPRSAAVFY